MNPPQKPADIPSQPPVSQAQSNSSVAPSPQSALPKLPETPQGEQVLIAQTPPPPEPHSPIKIILAVIVVLMLLITALGGGTYYYLKYQKAQLHQLAKRQIDQLNRLEDNYSKIVSSIQNSSQDKTKDEKLLGVSTKSGPEVLGVLEESAQIKFLRQMSELYKNGQNLTDDIKKTNQSFTDEANFSLISFLLPKSQELTSKTNQFSENAGSIFTYFDEENKLAIKTYTAGFDIGTLLVDAILKNSSEDSLKTVQGKIDNLGDIEREYNLIKTSDLPQDLQKMHTDNLQNFSKAKSELTNMVNAVKNKDADTLKTIIKSSTINSVSTQETSTVKLVSFWQDDSTLRSISQIRDGWQKLYQNLQ